MNAHVLDTHPLYWHLIKSPRLGKAAAQVVQDAAQGNGTLLIPSIVIAEFYSLNEKLHRPLDFANTMTSLFADPQYQFIEFAAEDVLQFDSLATIPDMHDRIITGVALKRGVPVITRDALIVNSGLVQTVW